MNTDLTSILKKYWGHQAFRPLQEDIVRSVLSGRDTIALLPTGGGKSICFQVPAMAMEGTCIVISPLIALMRDQVENLKKKGISAVAINSSLSSKEIDIALDNAVYGSTKFLYMSPERLQTDIVKARIHKMKVSLLAIDEAHCISEWGHDFRPAYRLIAEAREILGKIPLIALTATATEKVVEDIAGQLEMKEPAIFRKSFVRDNLIYVVQEEENKFNRLQNIVHRIGGSGIVYVSTRRDTIHHAQFLRANGIGAMPYHGGMDYEERQKTQELWISNKAQIVVATNAFGMGIDKPDVRFVVHMDLPANIEAYFQEAGRGGRDGKIAYAICLVNETDRERLTERVTAMVPDSKEIKTVYRALVNYFQLALGSSMVESIPFDLKAFSKKYSFNPTLTLHALKALEFCGYLSLSDAVHNPARLKFLLRGKELYSFEVGNPKYEKLIHLLLRSYEGIFDQAVKINENNIGIRLKIAADEVRKLLISLHEMRVVNYREQTDFPFISFPTQRLKPESLIIDKEYLKNTRERLFSKMVAIRTYSENPLICRSRQLVLYFGENASKDCGKCDVCVEKRKKAVNQTDMFEAIAADLNTEISQLSKPVKSLDTLKKYKEKDVIEVLRWMVDNKILLVDRENCLHLPQ